jgi:tetratricopeptide (TPR) repeat protein
MRALIDWSYNLLGQDERRLFARLGIFVGGWTLQAAETVCGDAGLDPSRIVDLLTALVDKSQVVAEHRGDHTRYRLLESVREYALEKLDASGERQVLALGHARWVAAFAEEAEAAAWSLPRRPWIKSIAPERDNVRAALTWATASEDSVVLAGRIAAALGLFWFYSGQADEGRIRIEELLGRLSGAECAEVTAKLWGALAALRAGAGRVQAARRAIEAFERLGDRRRLAVSFLQLAIAYRQMAEFTDAMAAIDRSVALFRETGDDGSTYCASALGWRASALIGLERFEEARSIFEKDIALHDALRDAGRAAIERLHSAELEFAVGNVRAAIELVEHGIEMLRAEARETRLSNDYSQVVFYLNLAAYRLVLGEIEAASVAARRALKRAQQVQYPLYTAIAVQHFATIAALRGQPALASRLRGFVNEVYRVQGVAREPTERRIDDLLVETLRDAPATAEIERNLAAGALLSEAEAVRLSFALGEPRGRTVPSVKSPAEERGFAGNH